MTTTMNNPIVPWNLAPTADSVYLEGAANSAVAAGQRGTQPKSPPPDDPMPTSHFIGVLAVPVGAAAIPLLAAWAGAMSWWAAIPVALVAAVVLGFGAIMGYDAWLYRAADQGTRNVTPSQVTGRREQNVWRDDLGAPRTRLQLQRHYFERGWAPKVRRLEELQRFEGEAWWARKVSTSRQLQRLDQDVWRSYAKLEDYDHVVSGPAGIFAVHDVRLDNITVHPSPRPQLDVAARFDDPTAVITLLTVEPTSPEWMRLAPASHSSHAADLNALPHQTSSCTLAATNDDREVDPSTVLPASVLETDLLEQLAAAGVGPSEYTIVLVAHGATMSNPVEYVELSYSAEEAVLGGAWLVHPSHLTEFLTSRPEVVTNPVDLRHGHELAQRA